MALYELVGTSNPSTDWTTAVVLERDETTGEITKQVGVGQATELTPEQVDVLENQLGLKLKSFDDESDVPEPPEPKDAVSDEAAAEPQQAGEDAQRQAPVVGEAAQDNPQRSSKRRATHDKTDND